MNKVVYFQKFYYLHNESFYTNPDDRETLISYMKVIPVYVYSINKNWDGEETFDVCPIDFSIEPKNTSWRWRSTKKYNDIGSDILNTKKEADKIYDRQYPVGCKDRELADQHKKQLREKKLSELLKK